MEGPRLRGDWGVKPGDVVRTKKAHPCGGNTWRVIREGADVKMECRTCGRVVSLTRAEFLRRVKAVLTAAESAGC